MMEGLESSKLRVTYFSSITSQIFASITLSLFFNLYFYGYRNIQENGLRRQPYCRILLVENVAPTSAHQFSYRVMTDNIS
jgi:hypothetical protein